MTDVTFDQPVKAKLVIELENGVKLEPTPENIRKFGYVNASETYGIFRKHVSKVLWDAGVLEEGEDLTDNPITSLRYIFELACMYPSLLEDNGIEEVNERIVALAKLAKEHLSED